MHRAFDILFFMNVIDKPKTTAFSSVQRINPKKYRLGAKILAVTAVLYLLLDWGGKARLVTRVYEIEDARIRDEIRLAVLCDLHGALYGEGQNTLISALEQANPDAVLLLGDLFDQHGQNANSFTLLQALSGRFDCYYILGNHEYKSGMLDVIRAALRDADIPVLSGKSAIIRSGGTQVHLFGVDDGLGGKARQLQQIANAAKERTGDIYSILAIHVPNGVESYLHYGFDLMLSGHTHGGQIILPGLMNGLYAPGQGLFPQYGGGRYDFGAQTLVISRGLARKPFWLPRVCNPPELTVITLKPPS